MKTAIFDFGMEDVMPVVSRRRKDKRMATINIGRLVVSNPEHRVWDVATHDGEIIDSFTRREHAIAFAKALQAGRSVR